MDARKLEKKVLKGFGSMLLKRFCGKSNSHLNHLVSRIRTSLTDGRIGIEVDVDHNEIILHASPGDMDDVLKAVNQMLELERKLLESECLEKWTHEGRSAYFVLFGAGAEILHLGPDMRHLSVDICVSNLKAVDDKMVLIFLEEWFGGIAAVHKFSGCRGRRPENRWGSVTFISPEAASLATSLNRVSFNDDGFLHLSPSKINYYGREQKIFSSPWLEATICWPRRRGKGSAIVGCNPGDVPFVLDDFSPADLIIGGSRVWCEPSAKFSDAIFMTSLDKDCSESQILAELSALTPREILGVFLFRGKAVKHPPLLALEEALLREISSLAPMKRRAPPTPIRVRVFQPEPNDAHMRATITFYGNQHLEAAKLLEQMEGKVEEGDGYQLATCLHHFCRPCLVEQCESAIRSCCCGPHGFPLRCLHEGCGTPIIVADLKSLLAVDRLEELFRASLSAFVAGNPCYRFCPSPDCPSIYRVTTTTEDDNNSAPAAFVCGACYAETCTGCHQEHHPHLSCSKYREFRDDPDLSLKEWSDGKENVKNCPACKCTVEKVDGCNHVECRCGTHVCWACLDVFQSSDDCYNHMRSIHLSIG
ncbi:unnamed protein product [Cuscuta campestris]|uniref:RING-type domain-containing protein n=1 Tax=Cuscuta campestris TaxID=132261 RepID=A0A484LY32_9ASTE|nr:unnamed protein product [Cuscuta campestris]